MELVTLSVNVHGLLGWAVADIKEQGRKPTIHLAMHDQLYRNPYRRGKSKRKRRRQRKMVRRHTNGSRTK